MDATTCENVKGSMETSLQKRLKLRMDMMGMNPHSLAVKAGVGDDFVRDILRGKSRKPGAEKLAKIASALETTLDWFTSESDLMKEIAGANATNDPFELTNMVVKGTIQAGTWLDRTIFDDDYENFEVIPVARDPRFPRAKQYGLKIEGDSMDEMFPDGTFVSCVDFADSGLAIRPGLIVHVERRNGHLVELTLKVIDMIDGKLMLAPRSSNKRHLPIPLEGDSGTEIVLCGIVTGSYRRTEL